MVLFVTKEPETLLALLESHRKGLLKVDIPLIVGTEPTLAPLAKKYKIPFKCVSAKLQTEAEKELLTLLVKANADFVVLARYMRILTPNFVWRYPNRIINIHPSLLPAFTGASAYVQAYERGAQIVGATAHFVTEELDKGPIIWQESFRVKPNENLDQIKARGKAQEAKTLLEACKLYANRRLRVSWSKVIILPLKRKRK